MPIEHMETSTTTSSMTSCSCFYFPPPKFSKLEAPINLSPSLMKELHLKICERIMMLQKNGRTFGRLNSFGKIWRLLMGCLY